MQEWDTVTRSSTVFNCKLHILYCYQFIKYASHGQKSLILIHLTTFRPVHHLNVIIAFYDNERIERTRGICAQDDIRISPWWQMIPVTEAEITGTENSCGSKKPCIRLGSRFPHKGHRRHVMAHCNLPTYT